MSNLIVKKGSIAGELTLPPSKSQTLRAILFGTLARGASAIHHPLKSPDSLAMIQACRALGAKITQHETHLEIIGISGQVQGADDVIHAGNSGIVLRMLTAVAALGKWPIVITGDHSIRTQRPILPLLKALQLLNVSAISTKEDQYAPVIVQGPHRGGITKVDGQDSQPVSALLIASSFAPQPTIIHVENPGEKPWIDLTLCWLKRLGISYRHDDYTRFEISGKASIDGFEYTVPGDLSTASFPISAALITGSEITLHNADFDDAQGDKKLIAVFQEMGARIEIDRLKKTVKVHQSGPLRGVDVDINDFVDSFNVLAATACFAEGKTHIRNAAVARQKECDRISCTAAELKKLGAKVEEQQDGLTIHPSKLSGATLFSHHDHRMAMALAVAAMGSEGETRIEQTDCVAKTFPDFASEFIRLGANIRVVP